MMDNLWEKINAGDVNFRNYPDAVKQLLKPVVLKLPETFADLLEQPATLRNLMKAKLRYTRILLGMVEDIVNAIPESELRPRTSRDEVLSNVQESLEGKIAVTERLLEGNNLYQTLERAGNTEGNIMLNELNPEMAPLYSNGQLTIGILLERQPTVFVKGILTA